MSKDRLEELRKRLGELKVRARSDETNLPIEKLSELFGAIRALEDSAENYCDSLAQPKPTVDLQALERARRKLTVIEAIEGMRNPSYFDEFAATLAEHPYALPRALFDAQGREIVTIDLPNSFGRPQFQKERTDLALAILYPGSFTYRYYGLPTKIETGQWSQTFVARLRMHTLSPSPIFKVEKNGRKLDVYKPIVLRARQVDEENPFICMNCLSLAGLDEGCYHSPHTRRPLKLPSSSPITQNQELQREEGESVEMRAPLDSIISKVTYLRNLKVGTAVLGFERSVPVANRVTIVDYDPPIGVIMETKGITFRVNIPSQFLESVMQRTPLVRDVVTQILAKRISDLLSENGMPSYHLEPILSGLMHSIGLDSENVEVEPALTSFSHTGWIKDAVETTFAEGAAYYERFAVQQRKLQALFDAAVRKPLNEAVIRTELKTVLMHSLAHSLLIAGCVTAGCLPTDLEYLIGDDEIVLFDAADGGNGSSEMIFEFCTSKEPFEIAETAEDTVREKTYRPKFFDEAFAELLLPCQQGVAERIFHRGFAAPNHEEIKRRYIGLERQKESYSNEYQSISNIGVENCFRSSIGYHFALTHQLQPRQADRLKEALSICLHGCPDCLVLGSKCNEGGFMEKYFVSKAILDEYFRYLTHGVTLDYSVEDSVIESLLKERGVVILTERITRETGNGAGETLLTRVSEFSGRGIDHKFVRFAGYWVDSPLEIDEIRYDAMLVLV